MVDSPHIRFDLPDRTYQAIVRSELRKLAESAGFSGHRLGEIEIIIAEITTNLIKYANTSGYILARPILTPAKGIEIIAIDDGPGMRLPLKMMEDGRTTKSSLGQGLGAIKRLSNVFDLFSLVGWGTVLFSRSYINKAQTIEDGKFIIDVLRTSKKDEKFCGDGWKFMNNGHDLKLVVIDGLGHGEPAYLATEAAIKSFRLYTRPTPVDQLRTMHEDVRKTRGVVATVVHIDIKNRQVVYSGVGNISMRLVSDQRSQGCATYNGIVGHIMPASLNNHTLQLNVKSEMLILHSDGLMARWDLKKYPGILKHHSVVICAALYKDFNRGNDDTTILIGRS